MRLAEVQAQVTGMEELLELVGAMRSLAGMHLHAALQALQSVHRYAEAMATAVRKALQLTLTETHYPSPERGRGRDRGRALVLCMSEHGFVGGFNNRLLQTVAVDYTPRDALLVLGSRGAALASERGHRVRWQHAMPTRIGSVPEVVRQTEAQIFGLIARAQASRAEVIYACMQRSGSVNIERRQLFPLELPSDPALDAGSLPPLHNLAARQLLEQLTSQYLSAQLTAAVTESVASENGARLATMEAAHDNVTRRLEQLRQQASEARQDEITNELLDLMIGELAVTPQHDR